MTGYSDIAAAVTASGLTVRGGFHPGPEDEVPAPAGTLILVGNAGLRMWAAFDAARGRSTQTLDDWSAARIREIAGDVHAEACFPFERPYRPFQRWAQMAESCHVSPLGILIHPEYGLWHGYRGALILADQIDLPPHDDSPSPCETCAEKPCLHTCPVSAFSDAGYDVPACGAHIAGTDGADCMALGCRARRACPVGQDYLYEPDQALFHMTAFRRNLGGDP